MSNLISSVNCDRGFAGNETPRNSTSRSQTGFEAEMQSKQRAVLPLQKEVELQQTKERQIKLRSERNITLLSLAMVILFWCTLGTKADAQNPVSTQDDPIRKALSEKLKAAWAVKRAAGTKMYPTYETARINKVRHDGKSQYEYGRDKESERATISQRVTLSQERKKFQRVPATAGFVGIPDFNGMSLALRSYYDYRSSRVHVKGYRRRDGTYVRPHTRSWPSR